MSLKNTEVEFKYSAKINITDFKRFCEDRSPLKFQIISGFDHFMSNPSSLESFYRHRVNTLENQLTFKRKRDQDNNYIREERNIDLPLSVSQDKVEALCAVHGYVYNTSIFKNCFIYNYDYYTLVLYVCYDVNLVEKGRFLEIEMKEDHPWSTEQEAYSSLLVLEKTCKTLGASPEARLSQSLFEMFRKKADGSVC